MVVVDGAGVPWGDHLHAASPSEVRLAEETLTTIRVGRKQRARRGIEWIAMHRKNRRKPPTQDGRALRRYRRRWTVERTIAWLGNFRRLVMRYDRALTIYRAFFHIACFMIVLRRVLK